jgi:hypothetical protein
MHQSATTRSGGGGGESKDGGRRSGVHCGHIVPDNNRVPDTVQVSISMPAEDLKDSSNGFNAIPIGA